MFLNIKKYSCVAFSCIQNNRTRKDSFAFFFLRYPSMATAILKARAYGTHNSLKFQTY